MAVRFIIGRGGTGKTHRCLESIRSHLITSPADGPALVFLVPEQASLQMERSLLCGPGPRATGRAEVLSFRRLAYRILQATHRPERKAISPQARAMVLRAIVAGVAPRLRYYRRIERLFGFWERLGAAVGELIEEAVTPAGLRAAVEAEGNQASGPSKLADLADIYAAYLEYLGTNRLDSSQHLQVAREALGKLDYLRGAHVWVDGFAGLTRQESLLLADVSERAAEVEITLLIDPARQQAAIEGAPVEPSDLFGRPLRTYRQLLELFSERHIAVEQPVALSCPAPRFAGHDELAQVERALAGDGLRGGNGAARSPKDVHMVLVSDRRSEVELAVAEVIRIVRGSEGRIRYRDIAIIVRDLDPYHDLLSAALAERNVPFFIDQRRPAGHHPVVELLRSAVEIAASSYSRESVRMLLKTGLVGLADEVADELENYVLAHGIHGRSLWTGPDWGFVSKNRVHKEPTEAQSRRLESVNAARRRVVEFVDAFGAAATEPADGKAWAAALRGLLERNAIADEIERWARQAESSGRVALAEEHRQVLRDVAAFLDDVENALADLKLDVAELAGVLEAGLSQLTLGLIPPTLDQVLVGSIERSRHPELKVAIVIGCNEGVFPQLASEDAILTDEDRERLADSGVRVGVTRRQRILDEAMLFYVAVTRPSETLLVMSAAADNDGKALRPSPYLQDLQAALPGLEPVVINNPARTRAIWHLLTAADLAAGLALEMRGRPAPDADRTDKRQLWNDLYIASRARDTLHPALKRLLASLAYRNLPVLSPQSAEQMLGSQYRASVSELETFASCPFQRFGLYGLRLLQREEADLEPADVGTVHHAILEEFINDCLQRGENFALTKESDVLSRLEQCAKRIGASLGAEGYRTTARDAYLLMRSAQDLAPVLKSQQAVLSAGAFRPRAAEAKFGFADDPKSLPALDIDTPLGRRVLLRGFIDRVDLAEVSDTMLGIVVDYKRTFGKRLNLAEVYHGLSIQLLAYLLVLAEQGETLAGRRIIPAGAFYVSLLNSYRAVDHPRDAEDDEDNRADAAPRGVLDVSRIREIDASMPDTGRSAIFNCHRRKDGSLGFVDSSDAADAEQFAGLLELTKRRLGELADGVIDGDISVSPYRLRDFSPCHWCRVQAVCRFEFGDPGMRHLESLKRSEVFERLQRPK